MSDNNDNSGDDLGGLLWMGILGYAAYKLLKSKPTDDENHSSKKRLSSYEIEPIVNHQFNFSSINDDEIFMTCVSCMVPDILGIKKEHYDEMLMSRLHRIDGTINSMMNSDYEGYKQELSESQFKDLISFIRNDCYDEIKETKFIYGLKGKLMSFLPGMKLIGKIKNSNIDYKVLKAIRDGLTEFFSSLYVYGSSFDEAKRQFKYRYVYTFNNLID